MFTRSSPLLQEQHGSRQLYTQDPDTPVKLVSSKSKMPSRIYSPTFLWNFTILLGLIYGVWVFIGTIQATLIPGKQYCVNSVATAYNYITFSGPGYGSYYGPKCINPTRIKSTYISATSFCTIREVKAGFDAMGDECLSRGFEFLDWRNLTASITDEEVENMKMLEFDEVPNGQNFSTMILLSQKMFEKVDNTLTTWEYEMQWHHRSGFTLYGFWAIVLIIAAMNHILEPGEYPTTGSQKLNALLGALKTSLTWAKTNLVVPPTFGSRHQRLLFWCTIPTRMESVIIAAFYLLVTYLSATHYRVVENNIYWDDKSQQFWRYVADRTGIMSYATLPLIWVFAGRNNVFMWATGLTYQAFSIYHRHIARAGAVLAIVHSVVYTWLYIKFEGLEAYTSELSNAWFFLGITATFSMCLLLLFSISWLRMKFYELFLILHIALSVIVLVGCFIHTSIFDKQYDAYLWPLVVIWLLDRALRLARLVLCNFRVRFNKNTIHRSRTTATYSKASDVIRLDIMTDSPLTHPKSGQFYQLYQPARWQGYENHPFTLGAWSYTSNLTEDESANPLLSRSSFEQDNEVDQDSNFLDSKAHVLSKSGRTLAFFIRPYDGWTKRLRDECLQSPNNTFHPLILVEGPYGHHHNLTTYNEILLIAGGTGIASAIPYILEHMHSNETNKTLTSKIRLLWTSRQAAFIHEIFERELLGASRRDYFEAELFCTQGSATTSGPTKNDDTDDRQAIEASLEIQYKRPNIAEAIRHAAEGVSGKVERLAVLVCGPPAMADEARTAVHESLLRGLDFVEYFEESFGW